MYSLELISSQINPAFKVQFSLVLPGNALVKQRKWVFFFSPLSALPQCLVHSYLLLVHSHV